MTKESKHTILALIGFFFLLVLLGTLNKTQDSIVYESSTPIVDNTITIEELPIINGTASLAWSELPMLEDLPSLTGIASPTEDELPHLTLPPLQEI